MVKKVFILLFVMLVGGLYAETNGIPIQYFYTEGCYKCGEVKQFFDRIERQYSGRVNLERLDIADLANYKRMMECERRHGVSQSAPLEAFAVGQVFLGHERILRDLAPALATAVAALPTNMAICSGQSSRIRRTETSACAANVALEGKSGFDLRRGVDSHALTNASSACSTEEVLARLRPWLVAGAGLVDGINPCAFATIVFLISILASGRYAAGQIAGAGLAFSAAVFLAYFLMGFGAMKALHRLDDFRVIAATVYWLVVVLALIAGVWQARDAVVYARTGDASAMGVKMPEALRARMRVFLRERLRGRYLAAGCFATGFVVSVLEVVCTGQIYLPTIMVVIQDSSFRGHGVAYLLLYNLMFIIPLLAVMGLTLAGVAWQKFLGFSRRSVVVSKAALAALFFALAAFMSIARMH